MHNKKEVCYCFYLITIHLVWRIFWKLRNFCDKYLDSFTSCNLNNRLHEKISRITIEMLVVMNGTIGIASKQNDVTSKVSVI